MHGLYRYTLPSITADYHCVACKSVSIVIFVSLALTLFFIIIGLRSVLNKEMMMMMMQVSGNKSREREMRERERQRQRQSHLGGGYNYDSTAIYDVERPSNRVVWESASNRSRIAVVTTALGTIFSCNSSFSTLESDGRHGKASEACGNPASVTHEGSLLGTRPNRE